VPSRLITAFQNLLAIPVVSRIRRNHGLEHATLTILSQKYPGIPLAGHSTASGFRLIGEVSAEAVRSAVEEALRRMNAGEHRLAVHPNCGTNFITSGTFAGLAGASAMMGAGKRRGDKLERLPLAIVLATLALIISYPFGLLLQEQVTTSGEPDGLEVAEIRTVQRGNVRFHSIITRG
jgi:hypothetical protein